MTSSKNRRFHDEYMPLKKRRLHNRKGHYVPDLMKFGATCEANYQRLLSMVPESEQARIIELYAEGVALGRISVKRIERCKYTDTLLLEQVASTGKWVNNPQFRIRLYHDAKLAEVIDYQRGHQLKGVEDYPNRFMRHPDEKYQLNHFLAEWLIFCLRHGHSAYPAFSPQ